MIQELKGGGKTVDDAAISIRRAGLVDVYQLGPLFVGLDEHHMQLRPDLFKQLNDPARDSQFISTLITSEATQAIFVAEELASGSLIGFAHVLEKHWPESIVAPAMHSADLDALFVKSMFRRRGVAKLLVGASEEWGKERHLDLLTLSVRAFNPEAIAAYQTMGFEYLVHRMGRTISTELSTNGGVHVRQLNASDADRFRSMRLEALRLSPGSFSSSLAREQAAPPGRWLDLIEDAKGAVFGLFDGSTMIGLTCVYTDRDDPSGETAGFAMSYIVPDYRGRGLSELLYIARLDWVRARPQFKRVLVGHRASNEASRRANQHHGFRLIERSPRVWPDGQQEDELTYELSIR